MKYGFKLLRKFTKMSLNLSVYQPSSDNIFIEPQQYKISEVTT
jgi:hypothetical protein